MKIPREEFPKKVKAIRDNDTYSVHDLDFLRNINVSMTVLHPARETGGHSHEKEEEVYVFFQGSGMMQLGDERFDVKKDDIILIPSRKFHKVFNTGKEDLVFLCIFEKYAGRGK